MNVHLHYFRGAKLECSFDHLAHGCNHWVFNVLRTAKRYYFSRTGKKFGVRESHTIALLNFPN